MELDDLWALEEGGWEALSRGEGADFYREVMHPEGLMVLPHGLVLAREAVGESLVGVPPWSSYALSERRSVPLGAHSVALVYVATATREGEEPYGALMSSVYAHHGGRWRLVLHQQTPRPASED